MVSFPAPQNYLYTDFKGIRTRNGLNSNGQISAMVCQNIDFVPNPNSAGIQIVSALGNALVAQYPDYKLIKGFESVQNGVKHCLIYLENDTYGALLEFDILTSTFKPLLYGITTTGKANGITMNDNTYDIFVFTNGVDYYSVNFAVEPIYQIINPVYKGKKVTGLAICEQQGSLVIGSDTLGIVIGSRKGDIYDWDYVKPADDNEKPWYQIFGKPVTAIVPYIDGLMVFTKDDSTLLRGNASGLETFVREDASLGGCMSFESWCFHDKYLFFYDNTQKNVYYYLQNNIGQKVLGEPVAVEVQNFFTDKDIERLQMVSFVGKNRSEIWLLSDNFKLIYDYYVGEWTERVCQELTSYFVFDNDVYSTTNEGKLLREKASKAIGLFDEVFYPAVYTMQTINLGSYSNMKEMEMQPLITVTQDYNNVFTLDVEIDGKKTKTKKLAMWFKGSLWGDDTDPEEVPENEMWDSAVFTEASNQITQQIKGRFVPNWYYLKFTIRTEKVGEDFNIVNFELKGLTQETDTTGRK